ncbi:MAG: hypothetical protein U5L46_02610 [Agrobacterium sp.]|nr:hypothetical protein [Agrobacterium sp.]
MKATDQRPGSVHHPEISVSGRAALAEIFNTMATGAAFAPAKIARTLNSAHRQALSRIVERIEQDEVKEEDLQTLWRAHHGSDCIVLMAPLGDLIRQISRC